MKNKNKKPVMEDSLVKAHAELESLLHPEAEEEEGMEKSLLTRISDQLSSLTTALTKGMGKGGGEDEEDEDEEGEDDGGEDEGYEKSFRHAGGETFRKSVATSANVGELADASQAMFDLVGAIEKSLTAGDRGLQVTLARVGRLEAQLAQLTKSMALLLETHVAMKKSMDASPKSNPATGIYPFFNLQENRLDLNKGKDPSGPSSLTPAEYDRVNDELTKAVQNGQLAPQVLADFAEDPMLALGRLSDETKKQLGVSH